MKEKIYPGGITGSIEGEITEELMKNFNNRLAIALIKQYGDVGARMILEGLKKGGK